MMYVTCLNALFKIQGYPFHLSPCLLIGLSQLTDGANRSLHLPPWRSGEAKRNGVEAQGGAFVAFH